MYIQKDFTNYLNFKSEGITYKVNESKGTVTAIAKFSTNLFMDTEMNNDFTTVGGSKT